MKISAKFLLLIISICLFALPLSSARASTAEPVLESIELTKYTFNYTGLPIEPTPKITCSEKKLKEGTDYTLTYINNTNAGTATVTATGIGNYSGSVSAEFEILPKRNTPKIQLSATRFTYDSKVKKPKVTLVTVGSAETPLDSSQYTVKYSSGCKNAGTYTVTVTLKGNYTGTNTKKFIIEQQSLKDAQITLNKRTYTYSGKAFKPKVTVKLNGVTLKKDTDYKVTYSNNINVGYGSVQVEGIGNYKHKSPKQSFLIRKDIQEFVVTPKAAFFKLSYSKLQQSAQTLPASKTLKISKAVGTVTYTIGYVSGRKYFNINQNSGTITVAKGTPKGTYTLTLKLCAAGDTGHLTCYRLVDVTVKVA